MPPSAAESARCRQGHRERRGPANAVRALKAHETKQRNQVTAGAGGRTAPGAWIGKEIVCVSL